MKYASNLKHTGILLFILGVLSIVRQAQTVVMMHEIDDNAISKASAGLLIGILLAVLGCYLFGRAKRL